MGKMGVTIRKPNKVPTCDIHLIPMEWTDAWSGGRPTWECPECMKERDDAWTEFEETCNEDD